MKHPLSGLSRYWLLAGILVIVLALASCADVNKTTTTTATPSPSVTASPTATVTPTGTATPTASESPSPSVTQSPTPTSTVPSPAVFILTPLYNVTVQPGDIAVTVRVSNFNIVDKIGQAHVAGEGHLVYYLDVNPPAVSGSKATTAAGTYFETAATSHTWTNIQAGNHTFAVQLVNNDGTPLTPAVITSVPVPVVAPSPSATVTATPTATPSVTP